jgi:hypothetical protein
LVGSDSKVAVAVSGLLPAWTMAHAANNKIALEMLRARAYKVVLTGEETSGQQDVELLRQIRNVRVEGSRVAAGGGTEAPACIGPRKEMEDAGQRTQDEDAGQTDQPPY